MQKLADKQKRHRIVFYQSALTLFAKQANNNAMMDLDQYCAIANASIRLRDGESLASLRKAGYANIHQWSKKYSVMQRPDGNGAITVLLEHPDFQRKKKGEQEREKQ